MTNKVQVEKKQFRVFSGTKSFKDELKDPNYVLRSKRKKKI